MTVIFFEVRISLMSYGGTNPLQRPCFFVFVLSAERCEGSVHSHHVRGGLQPGEARADGAPGARSAGAHSGATMGERKKYCSEEWGKSPWETRLSEISWSLIELMS